MPCKTNVMHAHRLTYNYGVDSYDIGEGFGHFAIATNDVYKLVDEVTPALAASCLQVPRRG